MRQLTAVDLFSGVGGLSLGLRTAGFKIGAAVELSPTAAAMHRVNFPEVHVIEKDIRAVRPSEVLAGFQRQSGSKVLRPRSPDLVVGGPPCQGFSAGGLRVTEDPRNELLTEFFRVVLSTRARYFVLENVPGLLSSRYEALLSRELTGVERGGYEVAEAMILNATAFGVPQNRRRVIIIGWRRGETPVDVDSLRTLRRRAVTVDDAIGDIPDTEVLEETLSSDRVSSRLLSRTYSSYARELRTRLTAQSPRVASVPNISGFARTRHSEQTRQRFAETPPGGVEPISRYYRLRDEGVSPTLRAGTGPDRGSHTSPRPIHPRSARVITVREAARLHSYPDWFQFSEAKWHAWREIGNSVPPRMAAEIARCIAEVAS